LKRAKHGGDRRNVAVALGNVGGPEAIPALQAAAMGADPLVAEHARWAIGQIRARADSDA
jgi:epoxyqueuosine reductase